MRCRLLAGVLLLGLALAVGATGADKPPAEHAAPGQKPAAPAQPARDDVATVSGAYTFRTYCASCHGTDGKGEGPMADNLRYHPPDLSRIAARNGGGFPTEKVVRIVDGRSPMKGHGGPDMPVWGDAFKNGDTSYDDKRVHEKIRGVVEYLQTLQTR